MKYKRYQGFSEKLYQYLSDFGWAWRLGEATHLQAVDINYSPPHWDFPISCVTEEEYVVSVYENGFGLHCQLQLKTKEGTQKIAHLTEIFGLGEDVFFSICTKVIVFYLNKNYDECNA